MNKGVYCCRYCVAPKRHPGCHSTCEEYLKQSKENNEKMEMIRKEKSKNVTLTTYDFDKLAYKGLRRRKKK